MSNIAVIGNLTRDIEVRIGASGKPFAFVSIAENRKQGDSEVTTFHDGTVFGEMAEHAAETFRKGDRVVMIGRLESSPREDEKTGFKYTKHSVLVDGLGPDVRFATAKVSKVAKAEGSGSAASSRPARDAQAEASGASYGDEEPF